MAKINIGVVGLGRIGWQQHCKALSTHKRFRLIAAFDPVTARGEEAQATFGVSSYTTYEAFLKHPSLDAVVIASPTHLHKAQTIAATKAGLHVILEKPMAMDIKEAKAIVRAAERYDRVLTVYQPHRLGSDHYIVNKLLKRKDLGKPYHMVMNWHRFVRRNDWQALTKYGGGMLANYGAHTIDFMFSHLGSDVEQVFGHLGRIATLGDAEDFVSIRWRNKAGVLGEININQGSLAALNRIQIYFTKGYVEAVDGEFHVKTFKGRMPKAKLITSLASEGRAYPRDSFQTKTEIIRPEPRMQRDFYANFADAIQKDKVLIVPPQDSLAVMTMMEQVRKQSNGIRTP